MIAIFTTLLLCCLIPYAYTQEPPIDCSTVLCAAISCKKTFVPDRECCEVCQGCDYKDRKYKENEKFFDGCNECMCSLGKVSCTEKACIGCTHKNKDYEHLAEFRDGCNDCLCEFGVVSCTKNNCPDIKKECPKTDGPGICVEQCESHEKCKKNELCCTNGCGHQCTKATVTGNGPSGCTYNGKHYRNGQKFRDICNDCSCKDGLVFCTMRPCAVCSCIVPECTNPVYGDCCPVCMDCEIEGRVYKNGQKVPCSDPCNVCTCSMGNIDSKPRSCPATNCDNPVQGKDQCCPTCPRKNN